MHACFPRVLRLIFFPRGQDTILAARSHASSRFLFARQRWVVAMPHAHSIDIYLYDFFFSGAMYGADKTRHFRGFCFPHIYGPRAAYASGHVLMALSDDAPCYDEEMSLRAGMTRSPASRLVARAAPPLRNSAAISPFRARPRCRPRSATPPSRHARAPPRAF